MTHHSHRIFALLIAGTAILFLAGYIAPLVLTMDNMAEHMASWRGLEIRGERIISSASGSSETHAFAWRLQRPGKASLSVSENSDMKGAQTITQPDHVAKLADVLLLSSNKQALFELLSKWGVSGETVALSRLEKIICVVVGAKDGDLKPSQFWIDKFGNRPARLVLSPENGHAGRLDIRMMNWDHPATNGLFPERIEFELNGRLVESWRVEHVAKIAAAK